MSDEKPASAYDDKLRLYEAAVAMLPEVKRKGAANPYTSVNGNMFSLFRPPGELALRLPADERERFLKTFNTVLFEAYGAVMKEYVLAPDALLADTAALGRYLQISYAYAKTLRPKPTTGKAKA